MHGVSTFERDAAAASLMGGRHRGPVIEVLEHSLGFTTTWDSCSSSAEDGAGWLAQAQEQEQ